MNKKQDEGSHRHEQIITETPTSLDESFLKEEYVLSRRAFSNTDGQGWQHGALRIVDTSRTVLEEARQTGLERDRHSETFVEGGMNHLKLSLKGLQDHVSWKNVCWLAFGSFWLVVGSFFIKCL